MLPVLSVTGKGKARGLVAQPASAEYIDRIRTIAKAKEPDDRVFTTHTGEPAKSLYKEHDRGSAHRGGAAARSFGHSALHIQLPAYLRDLPSKRGHRRFISSPSQMGCQIACNRDPLFASNRTPLKRLDLAYPCSA